MQYTLLQFNMVLKSTCSEVDDVQSGSEDEDDGEENAAASAPATEPQFEFNTSGKFF